VLNSDTQLWGKVTCRLSAGGPSFLRVTHSERNRDPYANQHSLAQTLALCTIKRKIRDCLHFSTVAAYSFWSENVNVSNLILGHPLFSPFMHQSIPAAPSTPSPPAPPTPRAEPRALTFFLPWMANFQGWRLLSCQIPRGGDEKRGQMPHPPSTLHHFSLIAQSNNAVLSILMCDFLF